MLALGVNPSRIIISNAFKPVSLLKFARDVGVTLTIADCEDELRKLGEHMPDARFFVVMQTILHSTNPNYSITIQIEMVEI